MAERARAEKPPATFADAVCPLGIAHWTAGGRRPDALPALRATWCRL